MKMSEWTAGVYAGMLKTGKAMSVAEIVWEFGRPPPGTRSAGERMSTAAKTGHFLKEGSGPYARFTAASVVPKRRRPPPKRKPNAMVRDSSDKRDARCCYGHIPTGPAPSVFDLARSMT